MSPRSILAVALSIALPFLTGACGVPLAVTAGSYAADGALVMTTNKTSADHFTSMVTKEDCAFWRVFRHQPVCKDRPDGSPDPYHVTQDQALFQGAQGPESATPEQQPAATVQEAPAKPPASTTAPTSAVAEMTADPLEAAPASAASPPPAKKKVAKAPKAKKPSPNQVASAH